jgi:hypothetical protein
MRPSGTSALCECVPLSRRAEANAYYVRDWWVCLGIVLLVRTAKTLLVDRALTSRGEVTL